MSMEGKVEVRQRVECLRLLADLIEKEDRQRRVIEAHKFGVEAGGEKLRQMKIAIADIEERLANGR